MKWEEGKENCPGPAKGVRQDKKETRFVMTLIHWTINRESQIVEEC